MYDGLHERARFKQGTLLFLPAPTLLTLFPPPRAARLALFADLVLLVRLELSLLPLSPRAGAALATLLERCAESPVHPPPPLPPSRTKWTRLVHPSILTGHVSSL